MVFYILLLFRCYTICYQNILEFFAFDGFYYHEALGDGIEGMTMFGEHAFGDLPRVRDYLSHFLIDLCRDLLRLPIFDPFAENCALRGGRKCDRTHFLRHAVAGDHVARERG